MSSKHTFFTGQPVFTQVLKLIPRVIVNQLSSEYKSNRYCKTFKAYDHLVTMLYQGFFQCLSLRELTTGMQANAERLRHLGLSYTPRRSTLADANGRRSADFFEALYHRLNKIYFPVLPDSRCVDRRLFIIDSTTISLFSSIMKGAGTCNKDGRKKGGAKAHVLLNSEHNIPSFVRLSEARHSDLTFLKEVSIPPGSIVVFDRAYINHSQFNEWHQQNTIWVTRLKSQSVFQILNDNHLSENSKNLGVLSDQMVMLGRPSNQKISPLVQARRIQYKDRTKDRDFTFITNDITLPPEQIAAIYKSRWQIELLFKRIKQRYPLRYFLGENENAIRIQIWSMLICDLLTQIVLNKVNQRRQKRWSYANLSSMLKHHLMTYIDLLQFLLNPDKALLNYREPKMRKGTLF